MRMRQRNFVALLLLAVIVVFNSCKKETVDVTDLLKSVPSSAAGVVVINMEGVLNDAGCKIKDHQITPSEDIMRLVDKAGSEDKKNILLLFDGSTGIEPKGAVVFYDSNRSYLTFALYDVNKFCSFVEKSDGKEFSDEGNGVKVNGNIAVKGAQAWICLTNGKKIDSDAIASYSSLATSQSFLTTEMGEYLLTDGSDIRGWALINTFLNEMLSRSERSMATLGIGFLFEEAESVKFKTDFKEGEMELEAVVLNDKLKPAKYLLPTEKVDVSQLKNLGSTCDAMMAFTLNSKLIKKFEQIGAAFGGALFGDLSEMFNNVDGTVGLISSGEGVGESMCGFITTKGEISPTLRDFISKQIAPISQEGKILKFSKGDVKGHLTVADCAEELKGCNMGIVFDATGLNSVGYGNTAPGSFKSMAIKFSPESGGLEIEVEIKSNDPKENILKTILKSY